MMYVNRRPKDRGGHGSCILSCHAQEASKLRMDRVMRVSWLLPLLLLLAAAMPAQARPRDDATSNAYRCSTIGALRPWLDCFYGAAQPVRAALGMAPATADQLDLSRKPPAGNVPPGDSRLRDDVMSAVLRCYAVPEDRSWLNCYYGAAQLVRARLGLSPGPQAPVVAAVAGPRPVPPPVPDVTPQDQFGLDVAAQPMGRNVDHITARMTDYNFSRFKIFTVFLSNGQVWRQLSGDISYAHWNKPAASYMVTISHGAFRSFNLQVKDLPSVFKVERLR
jgi:hypothetical protein